MSTLPIKDMQGKQTGEYELSDALLTFDKGVQALHDAVVAYQANQRQGSANTKGKGEVRGSNRKLWKQKGTGRARTGLRQSPIWRGGGVVFGPKPRSYRKGLPKKTARLAFRRAVSEKVAAGQLWVLEELSFDSPKTRAFSAMMKALEVQGAVLFITDTMDGNVVLSSRNVPRVEVTTADSLNTFQLVRYPVVIVTRTAMKSIEERLQTAVGSSV